LTLEALTIWQQTFATDMVPTNSPTWPTILADWMAERVDNKLDLPGLGGPGRVYTFNKSGFASALASMSPTNDAVAAITTLANAWASSLGTMVVSPGTYIEPATPSTTWSVVHSSIIDAPSIALAKAKVQELQANNLVQSALDSDFPVKFREAFLLLTVTTDGLDSDSDGPYPLTDSARAVG